ncbi:MAG: hypothetical protein KTR20_05495 [Cellvibrionaceae bacterium]|nr:hypothetical protein [Cellvibrionaceae bacterium]
MLDLVEQKPTIDFKDFEKVAMKTAKIIAVNAVPDSRKLLAFDLKCGDREFQILSGIKKYYPDYHSLCGHYVTYVENLAPRKIMGHLSEGMLLTVENTQGDVALLLSPPALGDNAAVI